MCVVFCIKLCLTDFVCEIGFGNILKNYSYNKFKLKSILILTYSVQLFCDFIFIEEPSDFLRPEVGYVGFWDFRDMSLCLITNFFFVVFLFIRRWCCLVVCRLFLICHCLVSPDEPCGLSTYCNKIRKEHLKFIL